MENGYWGTAKIRPKSSYLKKKVYIVKCLYFNFRPFNFLYFFKNDIFYNKRSVEIIIQYH